MSLSFIRLFLTQPVLLFINRFNWLGMQNAKSTHFSMSIHEKMMMGPKKFQEDTCSK